MQASRKDIALGPRPGKLKSTVRAPDKPSTAAQIDKSYLSPDMSFLTDPASDEEWEREMAAFGRPGTKMVNLDSSSDVELEVESPA